MRISSFIPELDILGLINAGTMYRGRHGRKRLVKLNVLKNKIEELLTEASAVRGTIKAHF
jgi:hypothetical protein